MKNVISHMTQPVKPILVGILLFFTSLAVTGCWGNKLTQQEMTALLSAPQNQFSLVTTDGTKIPLRMALTMDQKTRGLSGIMPEEFSNEEGMFFYYEKMGPRQFWMPDTYFNLQIIFLNEDLIVLKIASDVAFHPGRSEDPPIPRTGTFLAQYILEIKSSSELRKKIKIGDQLKWSGPLSLSEIKSNIHLLQ